jgi:hypothetical protein
VSFRPVPPALAGIFTIKYGPGSQLWQPAVAAGQVVDLGIGVRIWAREPQELCPCMAAHGGPPGHGEWQPQRGWVVCRAANSRGPGGRTGPLVRTSPGIDDPLDPLQIGQSSIENAPALVPGLLARLFKTCSCSLSYRPRWFGTRACSTS